MGRIEVVGFMELSEVIEKAPALRAALLKWWEDNGRHWIPWKLRPDGSRPDPGEPLCAFSTWSAEAKRK
jgi:A/G-specific adenine glycosylase